MVVIIIVLFLLVALLSYLVYVNYKRAERATLYCEVYVRFVTALYFRFRDTRNKVKDIDRIGAFQADDEVGFIFKEIDNSVDELYEFITKYINAEQAKETKETKN